jgi:hypothetical protein
MPDHTRVSEFIAIRRSPDHLQIVRKWFGLRFVVLALAVIGWYAFLVVWNAMNFLDPNHNLLFMLLYSFLHAALGVWPACYTLAGYVNKTVIDLDVSFLNIKHGPIPMARNKKILSKAIKYLYCKKGWRLQTWRPPLTYEVHVIMHGQGNLKLLTGLDSPEPALFIKKEIEKFLHIEGKPRGSILEYIE